MYLYLCLRLYLYLTNLPASAMMVAAFSLGNPLNLQRVKVKIWGDGDNDDAVSTLDCICGCLKQKFET